MGLKFEELAIKANHEDEKLNNAADKELKSRMRFGRPTKSSGLLDKKFKIFGLIFALVYIFVSVIFRGSNKTAFNNSF